MINVGLRGRGRAEEPEWIVILTVAIALLIGWFIQASVVNRMETASAGNISISYPASWTRASEEGALLSASDRMGSGTFGPRISLRQVPRADLVPTNSGSAAPSIADVASAWSIQRGTGLVGYRVLKIERKTLGGREAVDVTYAYLAEGGLGAAGTVLPQVMQAVDTLIATGDQIDILTFATAGDEFARSSDLHQRVLASWRLP